MGGSKKKKKAGPSYEEGRLRDPSIKQMQDADFGPQDLDELVKKVAKKKPVSKLIE